MLAQGVIVDRAVLFEQIDELSTRLMLNGVAALSVDEFERLGQAAAEMGYSRVASVASQLAKNVTPGLESSAHKQTEFVSAGLIELRNLLDLAYETSQSILENVNEECPDTSKETSSVPKGGNPFAGDKELIHEFITESSEHLTTIEALVLLLEQDPCTRKP